MFELFAAYLDHIVTPERKLIYLNACHALVAVNITEHADVLQQETILADNATTDDFLNTVENLLLPGLLQVIGEFGVVLNDTATLAHATDVLNSLQLIENYGDPETLYSLCDAPEGNAAALADILQLMGAYDAAEYLTILDRVSSDLLTRIALLSHKETTGPLPDALHVERARSRVMEFVTKYTGTLVEAALRDSVRLASPLPDLIGPFRDRIDQLPINDAAREIVGFLLASDVDGPDLRAALGAELELLWPDPVQLTRVDVAAVKLLKEGNYGQA